MATKRPSFLKRQKEMKRNARALEKREARKERKERKLGEPKILPDPADGLTESDPETTE